MEIVTLEPRNVETSERALREPITPAGDFYVRSHFAVPDIDPASWRLALPGGAHATLATLARLPQREIAAVLECAGNGRTRFRPMPTGTPWADGAVACGSFGGAPLADALRGARIPEGTVELVFGGAEGFERSLPLDVALHPDTLVCTRMNGAPLSRDHGAPARLLVPGWYGVASVKWLVEVRASAAPFEGRYQKDDYVYKPDGGPVTRMRVKSIVHPVDARVGAPARVTGFAWSGDAPIASVDVSTDSGTSWHAAKLGEDRGAYAWRAWSHEWTPAKAGVAMVLARAKDEAGNAQPWESAWNALGYGQNGITVRRAQVAPTQP
jgi:DMSO/TMAO reductase YedYZ molybdopterin-dependent catalytic subunit